MNLNLTYVTQSYQLLNNAHKFNYFITQRTEH